MTAADLEHPTVLIAAFSGRALAQSARRAGYRPLVVDCFGDEDTRAAAHDLVCLPARVQVGFTRRPLMAALDHLTTTAPSPPMGLVLGAGFECNPRLVAALQSRYRLIGNSAETIAAVKDPAIFFSRLTELGIRHPETRTTAPETSAGWLMKRIGGSGGLHIHACPAVVRPDPRRYFQRVEAGTPVSVLMVRGSQGVAFAFSWQWTAPYGKRPCRYGGACGSLTLPEELEALLIDVSLSVGQAFGLTGMVSLDFLLSDGEAVLLEVNPRPGASLDVLDDEAGTLFKAHMAACGAAGDPAAVMAEGFGARRSRAAAYLYADRGAFTAPDLTWPDWCADRPNPGTAIGRHQPIATVLAEADSLKDAEQLCRARLGQLENMLYETAERKDTER